MNGIQVRTGQGTVKSDGTFTDVVDVISRKPMQHAGWQSVGYKGKRYQLHGGVRTDYFISLRTGIKTNPHRKTRAKSRKTKMNSPKSNAARLSTALDYDRDLRAKMGRDGPFMYSSDATKEIAKLVKKIPRYQILLSKRNRLYRAAGLDSHGYHKSSPWYKKYRKNPRRKTRAKSRKTKRNAPMATGKKMKLGTLALIGAGVVAAWYFLRRGGSQLRDPLPILALRDPSRAPGSTGQSYPDREQNRANAVEAAKYLKPGISDAKAKEIADAMMRSGLMRSFAQRTLSVSEWTNLQPFRNVVENLTK